MVSSHSLKTLSANIPQAFIDFITPTLPAHLSIEDLLNTCQTSLRFSIRINTLKISHDNFIATMAPHGWIFDAIPWCDDGFWVQRPTESTAPGKLPEHLTGLFYIQEASSMMPPSALFHNANSGFDAVLDLAAAPGSKTTQIATLMKNKGILVANEFSSSRVKALHSNLQRLGICNTLISHFDGGVHGDYLENQFDAVLLDAPCSGEGTVRKDPDAFKNWSVEHINDITQVQKSLIKSAFMALKPGGELVYSTCALNGSENQGVCEWLLAQFPDNAQVTSLAQLFPHADKSLTPEGYLHIWPQIYNSEGFFVAKFTKTEATSLSTQPTFRSKFPYCAVVKKDKDSLIATLQQYLNIDDDFSESLYARDNEIWHFPQGSDTLTTKMRFVRHGVKVLDLKPKQAIINHDALTIWGKIDITLNREQCVDFLKGRDIAFDNTDKNKGEVLLGYQGHCVGLGKWVGNKIKNKLPRNLVNDNVEI
jgi:16S rRNA (cytosine1407-C5)-methyltransferase